MTTVKTVAKNEASGEVKTLYAQIEKNLGKIPNIFLNMGNSPAVLKGYLNLSEATTQTSLPAKLREQIALIVGQINQCNYCLSAHTAIGKMSGLSETEIMKA